MVIFGPEKGHFWHLWGIYRVFSGDFQAKFNPMPDQRFLCKNPPSIQQPIIRPAHAKLWALVRSSPCAKLTLEVSFHRGRKRLPIIKLKVPLRQRSDRSIDRRAAPAASSADGTHFRFNCQGTIWLTAAILKTHSENVSFNTVFATILRETVIHHSCNIKSLDAHRTPNETREILCH